jgi:hypothetical protein
MRSGGSAFGRQMGDSFPIDDVYTATHERQPATTLELVEKTANHLTRGSELRSELLLRR